MAFKFILLVLPALALAKIDVEISGKYNGDGSDVKVYYNGKDIGIISDEERNTFNLNDNNLKNAVRAYFGQRPDDAYLRSPTPWGDLYQTYGWSQVSRTLVPKSGKVLKMTSQPTIVVQQTFENNSTKPATFNVGISQSVSNTVSSSWSTGGQLSVGQKISYGIKLEVANVGGETSFSYTSSWGQSTQQSQTVTVGATSALYITLEPGEAVVAKLEATRGFVQVEMEYGASLSGQTAVNYSKTYKGHHFWGLPINSCMNSAGISNQKTSREVIDIGFYSDSRVVVSDKRSGQKLMDVGF